MQIDGKYTAKITKMLNWKGHSNLSKTFLRTDHWEIQNWLIIFKKMRSKKKKERKNAVLCFSTEICHVMPFLKAQVIFPSNFTSIFSTIKHKSSLLFFAQTLYTLVKSSPLKCKFLRFLSTRVKICQIPHVNFELTVNCYSIFAPFFIVMTHNSPVIFKLINFQL